MPGHLPSRLLFVVLAPAWRFAVLCALVPGFVRFDRYRSDSSMHRDDSLVGPPEKQRRTHDALPWEQCGTSFSGLPQNLPSSASSSPRPSCFGLVDLNSAERTSQSARSRQPVYYPPITRSSGSPMSMYGFDQYRTGPSPSLLDMNYYLSSLGRCRFYSEGRPLV